MFYVMFVVASTNYLNAVETQFVVIGYMSLYVSLVAFTQAQ